MLKGIDPRMTPELMHCLMEMGEGDELAIVDAHFPAAATAAQTVWQTPIRLAGLDAPAAIGLITGLMPLDARARHCALRMELDEDPRALGEVHRETLPIIMRSKPRLARVGRIRRELFLKRAAQAFAVVITGETRPRGCFILRKGMLAGNDAEEGGGAQAEPPSEDSGSARGA